jgi:amino acid transporter
LSLTSAALIIQYWNQDLNIGIVIAIFWVVFTVVNYLPVRIYGELETWLSSLKVITIVGFIIFAICIAAGVGQEGVLGFHFWRDPGAFNTYMVDGGVGKFVGFWAVMIQASVSYQGAELVGVGAGEARDPRKTVPRAIRTTFWGILLLFVVTIFLLTMVVPSNDPNLLSDSSDASASPLVIAAKRAGVRVLPDIINAVLLTAVLSAANSNVYSGSRVLLALAEEGHAPAILRRTNRHGIPTVCVAFTAAFGLLAFLNESAEGGQVFNWLLNITGVAGLTTWASTCLSHLYFMRALRAQGIPRESLPYVSRFQPYTAVYGLFFNVLVMFTQGFTVFIDWSTSDFFAAYISLILFAVLWAGHKLWYRRPMVDPTTADLIKGRYDLQEERSAADGGI